MAAPDLLALAEAVLSRRDTPGAVASLHCPTVPTPHPGTAGHPETIYPENGGFLPVSDRFRGVPPTVPRDSQAGQPDTPCPVTSRLLSHGRDRAGHPGNDSRPPADAAGLLRHIRDTLRCRVTLDGETVTIRPTHRCPPAVVAAVLAVLPAVLAILGAEARLSRFK